MSVNYEAVLFYGYDLTPIKDQLPEDFEDQCQYIGFDTVVDGYNNEFFYVGVDISRCDMYSAEVRVDVIEKADKARFQFFYRLAEAAKHNKEIWQILHDLNAESKIYHICYAT